MYDSRILASKSWHKMTSASSSGFCWWEKKGWGWGTDWGRCLIPFSTFSHFLLDDRQDVWPGKTHAIYPKGYVLKQIGKALCGWEGQASHCSCITNSGISTYRLSGLRKRDEQSTYTLLRNMAPFVVIFSGSCMAAIVLLSSTYSIDAPYRLQLCKCTLDSFVDFSDV